MYRKRHNRRKPMSQSQGSKRRGDLPQDSRLPKYILFPCSETRRQEKGGFYDREKQRQEASHLDIGTFYDACPAASWGIRRGWCRGTKALSRRIARLLQNSLTARPMEAEQATAKQQKQKANLRTADRRPKLPTPQGQPVLLLLPERGRTVKMKP